MVRLGRGVVGLVRRHSLVEQVREGVVWLERGTLLGGVRVEGSYVSIPHYAGRERWAGVLPHVRVEGSYVSIPYYTGRECCLM